MLHAQAIDQHGTHKVGCRQFTQTAIEGQAQHPVDAGSRQQLELVAQPRKAHRRIVRSKEFARLRLENHHATGQLQLGRAFAQTLQDSLMPTVHPIEITDGGHTAAECGLQIVQTSDQLHIRLLA